MDPYPCNDGIGAFAEDSLVGSFIFDKASFIGEQLRTTQDMLDYSMLVFFGAEMEHRDKFCRIGGLAFHPEANELYYLDGETGYLMVLNYNAKAPTTAKFSG